MEPGGDRYKLVAMKKYLIYAAVAVAVFVGAVLLGRLFRVRLEDRIRAEIVAGLVASPDTIRITDTVKIFQPMPDQPPRVDSVIVYVEVPGDTVKILVPVQAERVQKHYSEPQFEAWVSGLQLGGIGPALDSVKVPTTTQIITQTVAEPTKKQKPLRMGAEGFLTVVPSHETPRVSYGPAGYIKYKGEFFELKGWGGYDFAGKSAMFGATASIDILQF